MPTPGSDLEIGCSSAELVAALEAAGFTEFEFVQTIYQMPGESGEP